MANDHAGSNFLSAAKADIAAALSRANGASANTLNAFREIGQSLNEVKIHLATIKAAKGAFGEFCEQLKIGQKSWRAKIMKLAENWTDIQRALDQDSKQGGSASYSVAGALSCYASWLRANDPRKKAEAEAKAAKRAREKAERETAEIPTEREELLKRELQEERRLRMAAEQQLRELADLIAAARATAEPHSEQPKAANSKQRRNPDTKTKERMKKVFNLAQRPGTESEGKAARAKFVEAAWNHGMTEDQFIRACGIAA